ncbi:hypothetical protein [Prosthecobacter sp.]|uniref:hypothetical protein n=1 Tax=Prosthecobacter sp. TaxID=1965333 RepID=UPI003783588E
MKSILLNLTGQILFGLALLLCIPPVSSGPESSPLSFMPPWVMLALFASSQACIKLAGIDKGWSYAMQGGIFTVFVLALQHRLGGA